MSKPHPFQAEIERFEREFLDRRERLDRFAEKAEDESPQAFQLFEKLLGLKLVADLNNMIIRDGVYPPPGFDNHEWDVLGTLLGVKREIDQKTHKEEEFGLYRHRIYKAARVGALAKRVATYTESDEELHPITLTNEEGLVLKYLQASSVNRHNAHIEAATGLSKATVRDAVVNLMSKGLVHRPDGQRKGASLTTMGKCFVVDA